jgi:hypothetical protein
VEGGSLFPAIPPFIFFVAFLVTSLHEELKTTTTAFVFTTKIKPEDLKKSPSTEAGT